MGVEVAYIERWGVCRDPWLCDATLQPLSGSSVVFPQHVSTGVPCKLDNLSGSSLQGVDGERRRWWHWSAPDDMRRIHKFSHIRTKRNETDEGLAGVVHMNGLGAAKLRIKAAFCSLS